MAGRARDRVLLLAVLVALIACFVPTAGAAPTTPGWVFGFSSEGTIYDGNSHVGFGPSSDGMAAAGALQAGTIQITFTPNGVVGTQTLAHFSNGTNSSQEAHLSLEGSSLRWRLTGPTQTLTDVTVPVAIVPNVQHQIHLGVERGLLWIHLDGSPVYLGQSSAFLSSIGGMNNIHVGARRVSGNPVLWLDGFKGRIERLSVLNGMMPLPLMRKENRGNRAPGQNWHPVSLPDFVNLTPHLAPNRQTPTRWVVTGDSITQGAPHTYGYRSWSQQLQARLAELGNSSDIVINTAASGSTAASLTGSAFTDRVGRYRPHVVMAMVGMNDAATGSGRDLAAYRADLNAFITSTRGTGAIPILLTSNPVGPGVTTREQLPAYMQALREVAAQRQVIVVDAYGDWLYTNSGAAPAAWYADALHPNAHGHWQLARAFLELFEGGWSASSGIGADVVPSGGRRAGGAPTVSTGNPEQAYGWRFHPPANVFNDARGMKTTRPS